MLPSRATATTEPGMAANRVQKASPAAATQMWSRPSARRTRRRIASQPRPGICSGTSASRPGCSLASRCTATSGTTEPCHASSEAASLGRPWRARVSAGRAVARARGRYLLPVRHDRSLVRARGAVPRRPLVLDLDLLLAHGIAHGLGFALDVLAQADLLGDPCRLGDYRFLAALDRLDRALLEGMVTGGDLAVDRPPLDGHMLLPQLDLLFDRALGDVAAHPHTATANLALADPKLFFGGLDHLLAGGGLAEPLAAFQARRRVGIGSSRPGHAASRPGVGGRTGISQAGGVAVRCARSRTAARGRAGLIVGPTLVPPALAALVQVDRVGTLEYVHRCRLDVRRDPSAEQVATALETLGVGVTILIRHEQIAEAGPKTPVLIPAGRRPSRPLLGAVDRDGVPGDANADQLVAHVLGCTLRVIHCCQR